MTIGEGGGPANLLPFECPLSQPLSDQTFANSWTIRPRVTWEHLQVPAGLAEEEAMRFSKEFWRRRPDLNRGWRFCRQGRDVYLVDSSCFLVGPTPPFSPVFGRNCSQIVPTGRGCVQRRSISAQLAALDDVRNSSEKLRKSVSSRDSPGFRGHWQPPAVHRLRANGGTTTHPAPGDQLRHGVLVLPQARLSFRGHPSSTGAVPPRLVSRPEASPSRRTREGDRRVPPN